MTLLQVHLLDWSKKTVGISGKEEFVEDVIGAVVQKLGLYREVSSPQLYSLWRLGLEEDRRDALLGTLLPHRMKTSDALASSTDAIYVLKIRLDIRQEELSNRADSDLLRYRFHQARWTIHSCLLHIEVDLLAKIVAREIYCLCGHMHHIQDASFVQRQIELAIGENVWKNEGEETTDRFSATVLRELERLPLHSPFNIDGAHLLFLNLCGRKLPQAEGNWFRVSQLDKYDSNGKKQKPRSFSLFGSAKKPSPDLALSLWESGLSFVTLHGSMSKRKEKEKERGEDSFHTIHYDHIASWRWQSPGQVVIRCWSGTAVGVHLRCEEEVKEVMTLIGMRIDLQILRRSSGAGA